MPKLNQVPEERRFAISDVTTGVLRILHGGACLYCQKTHGELAPAGRACTFSPSGDVLWWDVRAHAGCLQAARERETATPVDLERASTAEVPPHQYAFPGDDHAPAKARDHVREALGSWRVPEDSVEAAVLVVSELTTNAVKHTQSSRIELELLRREGEVEMAVQDNGPRPAAPLQTILTRAGDTWDEDGRGLGIVHRLASRWGTAEAGAGLKVWAAIDTDGAR
ncbi:ATP-binding protein [Streptomyces bauhiniae]|uniref:ATP-binding protein n=2 Tax=Streptomyces bauhiniae TaxID=2340725 RepID=A0A4Z1CUJ1_9ACTN|nr:ATP-binding protein [Streptomyces bauhiniae]